MRIKMKTTSCGPDVTKNWSAGQIFDVSAEDAKFAVERGLAEALEPFPVSAPFAKPKGEAAAVVPKEKAVEKTPKGGEK